MRFRSPHPEARSLTAWCTNSSRRHHDTVCCLFTWVSNSVPAKSRFELSRIGRRCRFLRATATRPAAQQQLCIVAPCRNVARLQREKSRMIPQTAIVQIAKRIGRELNSGTEPSEDALAAGPILAEAGATPEIVGAIC